MIKASMIAACVLGGVLLTTSTIAATSTEANFKPTAEQKQKLKEFLRFELQYSMYESVYYVCRGEYICNCIHQQKGQQVVGKGRVYDRIKRVCQFINHPPKDLQNGQ